MFKQIHENQIPLLLLNARLTKKSYIKWDKFNDYILDKIYFGPLKKILKPFIYVILFKISP